MKLSTHFPSAITLASLLACSFLVTGCEKPLFTSDFAPTAVQKSEGGDVAVPILDENDGTNDDPTVDNPDFPMTGDTPAYAQPGNGPGY
ncbi:MAG: hypothetical protein EXS00_05690 [Phycisphaerales bacterium]|nr:hypothetical protein [Phycisphaerales bacterium]